MKTLSTLIIFMSLLLPTITIAEDEEKLQIVSELLQRIDNLIGLRTSDEAYAQFPSPSLQAQNIVLISRLGFILREMELAIEAGHQWNSLEVQSDIEILQGNLNSYSNLIRQQMNEQQVSSDEIQAQLQFIRLTDRLLSDNSTIQLEPEESTQPVSTHRFSIVTRFQGETKVFEGETREELFQSCMEGISRDRIYSFETLWQNSSRRWQRAFGWSKNKVCLSLTLYSSDNLSTEETIRYTLNALINNLPLSLTSSNYDEMINLLQEWIPRFELSNENIQNLSINGFGPIESSTMGLSTENLVELLRFNIDPNFPCYQVSGSSTWRPPFDQTKALPFLFFGRDRNQVRQMAQLFLNNPRAGGKLVQARLADFNFHNSIIVEENLGILIHAKLQIGAIQSRFSPLYIDNYREEIGGINAKTIRENWNEAIRGENEAELPITDEYFLELVSQQTRVNR